MCWLCVSGWTHDAVQWIRRGQPLKTLEKQAPMCTLGVGGRPFERGCWPAEDSSLTVAAEGWDCWGGWG